MKALVTGVTGFIGAAVTRALLDAGHEVRVLVRPNSPLQNLAGLDVEQASGDIRDLASLKPAIRGCETIFHVAADYRLWARDPKQLYDTNVTGTENILKAISGASLDRAVYTSSVCTLGFNPDGAPADESRDATPVELIGHYKLSKFHAEQTVRKAIERKGLPIITVNPSTPVGPGDIRPTPTGRMIREAALGRMPAYVDTGLNIVHVDDVAAGHLLALEKGRAGERYILGGENLTLAEILGIIANLTGRRPPKIRLSSTVVMPVAWLSELWARFVSGREPLTTVTGVKMSRHRMFFTSAKAERELGYHPRPAQEALADAVVWFGDSRSQQNTLSQRGAAGMLFVADDMGYHLYHHLTAAGIFTGLF